MRIDKATALVLTLAGGLPLATAQPQVPLNEAVRVYLLQDCGTGDPNPRLWLERVIAFGTEAVPLLSAAAKDGPDGTERAKVERVAVNDFRRLRAFLKEGGLRVQETEVRAAAEKLDEKTYVAMRLRSFVAGYQERAVNALAALRRPEADAALRALAADARVSGDVKQLVAEALKRVE